MQQPLATRDRASGTFVQELERHGGDRRARGRDAGFAVPQPRHHDGRAATRSRARTSRTRSPGGKPALDAGIESLPRQRPFLANTEGLMRELQPGVARAAHRRAGARERARRPASRCCRRRRRSTAAWSRCCRSCRRSPTTRSSRAASSTRPSSSSRCGPTLDYLAPDADRLQLPDAVVPQHLLAAERGRPQRHLAAVHHRHHAAGPEQRGRPVVGAGQRPDGGQPPAHQPVPEHRGAGPAARVRVGQRAVPGRPAP